MLRCARAAVILVKRQRYLWAVWPEHWSGRRSPQAAAPMQELSLMAISLLEAKIRRPTLPRRVVRPRIRYHLQKAAEGARVTVVWAGPGYGKTTAVLDFLEWQAKPNVWYQLGPEDTDVMFFLAHLAMALSRSAAAQPPALQELVNLRDPLSAVKLLCARLSQVPDDRFFLVLDDLHAAQSQHLMTTLEHLIRLLPGHVRLFLLSRERPFLCLENMLLSRAAAMITSKELRFTRSETEELYRVLAPETVGDELVDRALAETDGWVTGLILLLLSGDSHLVASAGETERVFNYLAEDVLQKLEPDLQEFLLISGVPDQFTAQLLQYLVPDKPAEEWLRKIRRKDLFLYRLDEGGYRYHELFRSFLRSRLPAEEARVFLRRTAEHYEARGDLIQALDYRLRAAEPDQALRLLERCGDQLVQSGQVDTLIRWTRELAVAGALSPRLHLHLGRAYETKGDFRHSLDHFQAVQGADDQELVIEGLLGEAQVLTQMGRSHQARQAAERTLELVASDDHATRGLAYTVLARAIWITHNWDRTEQYLEQAYTAYRRAGDEFGQVRALNALGATVREPRGNFHGARLLYLDSYAQSRELQYLPHAALTLANAAHAAAMVGEFDRAREEFTEALRLARAIGGQSELVNALLQYGEFLLLVNDQHQAFEVLAEAMEVNDLLGDPWRRAGIYYNLSIAHRLAGNIPQARRYAERDWEIIVELGNVHFLAQSCVNMAHVALTSGRLKEAREYAAKALDTALRLECRYIEVEARLLLAYLTGELEHLAVAFGLAAAHGYWPLIAREWQLTLPLMFYGKVDTFAAELTREVTRWLQTHLADSDYMEFPEVYRLRAQGQVPRIYLMGQFRLLDGHGRQLQFKLAKSQALFQLLVLKRGKWFQREALLDLFWPGLDTRRAQSNFRVTLHALRQTLREGNLQEWLEVTNAALRLSPQAEYWCDRDELEALGKHLKPQESEQPAFIRQQRALRVVELYSDGLLPLAGGDEWALLEREYLQEIFLKALELLEEEGLERQTYHRVIAFCLTHLQVDPLDEQACMRMLRAYVATGQKHKAAAAYQTFVQNLSEELGIGPSPELERLYRSIVG